MSIIKKDISNKPPKIALEIDNGDLEAMKNAMEQYGFVNEQALLRYALVSLLRSSDNKLYVRTNGNILAMQIAEGLLKKETSTPAQSESAE